MKNLLSFLVLISVVASSCDIMDKRIKGDGNVKTETREVGSFDKVSVSGNIDVYYTQGAVQPVRVETDNNLQQYIEVRTNGSTLRIEVRDDVNPDPTHDIKVYVSAPLVRRFDASGACHIFGENKITSTESLSIHMSGACGTQLDVHVPSVDTHLSGACSLDLKGETRDFRIEGSGSAEAKCFDLMAENVEVNISGAGEVEAYASVKLNVEVSGAANIKYKGNPAISKNISGAGSINKVD